MINTTPQIEELIDKLMAFINTHRAGKHMLYPNYNDEELGLLLRQAIMDKSLVYGTNDIGEITGVVNGRVTSIKERIFWVDHILITDLKLLPIFIDKFEQLFPSYTIYATRYGKERKYDMPRFTRKCKQLNFARN